MNHPPKRLLILTLCAQLVACSSMQVVSHSTVADSPAPSAAPSLELGRPARLTLKNGQVMNMRVLRSADERAVSGELEGVAEPVHIERAQIAQVEQPRNDSLRTGLLVGLVVLGFVAAALHSIGGAAASLVH